MIKTINCNLQKQTRKSLPQKSEIFLSFMQKMKLKPVLFDPRGQRPSITKLVLIYDIYFNIRRKLFIV